MPVAENARIEGTPPRAALTTGPGLGALAVVRVTGGGVGKLLDRHFRPVAAAAWRALREGATDDDLRRICFGRWPLGVGAGTEELVVRRATPAQGNGPLRSNRIGHGPQDASRPCPADAGETPGGPNRESAGDVGPNPFAPCERGEGGQRPDEGQGAGKDVEQSYSPAMLGNDSSAPSSVVSLHIHPAQREAKDVERPSAFGTSHVDEFATPNTSTPSCDRIAPATGQAGGTAHAEAVGRRSRDAALPGPEEAWELICHGGPAVAAALLATLAADGVEIVPPTHPAAAVVPLADALVRHAYLDLPAARTEATALRLLAQLNGALSRAVADLEARFAAATDANFPGENSHIDPATEMPLDTPRATAESSRIFPRASGRAESAGIGNTGSQRAVDEAVSGTQQEDDASDRDKTEKMRRDMLAAATAELAATTAELAATAAGYAIGRRLLEPARIVLAGEPNVGKSSLLNALLGRPRAIVSPQAGTTRDAVAETTAFEGWPVELCDTAGLRAAADPLEAAGIALTRERLGGADLVVWIFDASAPPIVVPAAATAPGVRIVWNKCDLAAPPAETAGTAVSAATGTGIDGLIRLLAADVVPCPPPLAAPLPWRAVHAAALNAALGCAQAGNAAGAAVVLRKLRVEGTCEETA